MEFYKAPRRQEVAPPVEDFGAFGADAMDGESAFGAVLDESIMEGAEGALDESAVQEGGSLPEGGGMDGELENKRKDDTGFKITTNRTPFVTGFDITTAEEQEKRRLRAEKFGVPLYYAMDDRDSVSQGQDELSKRQQRVEKFGALGDEQVAGALGVDGDAPEQVDLSTPRRWNAVHLYGTKMVQENMKTYDVLKLFEDYGPQCIEWMSGTRCNVVFGDPGSAKRMMMRMSKPLALPPVANAEERLAGIGAAPTDMEYLYWRVSSVHKPESTLLFRVATDLDVKKPFEERRQSKWFKKYWQNNKEAWAHKVKEQKRRKRAERAKKAVKKISLAGLREKKKEKNKKVPLLTMTVENRGTPAEEEAVAQDMFASIEQHEANPHAQKAAKRKAKRVIRLKKSAPY